MATDWIEYYCEKCQTRFTRKVTDFNSCPQCKTGECVIEDEAAE